MIDEKKCRLILKGLPLETVESDLSKIFKKAIGFKFIHKEGQKIKTCFIQFKSLEESKKANFDNLSVKILGKKINVEYCLPKDRYDIKKEEKKLKVDNNNSNNNKADKLMKEKEISLNKKVKLSKEEKNRLLKEKKSKEIISPLKSILKERKEELKKTKEELTFYLSNFSFKETEETIIEKMSKYGKIKSLKMEKNENKIFTGSCIIEFISFKKTIFTDKITSNDRLVEIKRKPIRNITLSNTRLFISNINKNLNYAKIEEILKENKLNPKISIKNSGRRNRNSGFCFLDFKTEQKVEEFLNKKDELKSLGDFKIEKSKEKFNKK